MKQIYISLAAALVIASGLTSVAAPQSDSSRLVPPSLSGFKARGPAKHIQGEQIYDYMDGAGEIPVACGYKSLTVQEYTPASGGVLTVELYDMGSSANAFGLYSMKRLASGKPLSLPGITAPSQAQAGFHEVLLHRGNFTVLVFADDGGKIKDADIQSFATALASKIKQGGPNPDLLKYLPREGAAPRTVKYFRGKAAMDTVKFIRDDLFRMKSKPEAAVCTYAAPAGKAMVVRYASATDAQAVLRAASTSSYARSMTLFCKGNLLFAMWNPLGKLADPRLIERVKASAQKPGAGPE